MIQCIALDDEPLALVVIKAFCGCAINNWTVS